MIRKTVYYLLITAFVQIPVYSQAADDTYISAIRAVDYSGMAQLYSLIKSSDININVKIAAIKRIGDIYKSAQKQKESGRLRKIEKRFIEEAGRYIKNNQTDVKPQQHHLGRKQMCRTLGLFHHTPNSEKAVEVIKEPLLNDRNEHVANTCGEAMAKYTNSGGKAASAVGKRILQILKKGNITEDNINQMSLMITAAEKLGHKNLFLPLMKVIQSGYPTWIKKEAERAIKSMKWN